MIDDGVWIELFGWHMSYGPGLLELRMQERGRDQLVYVFRSVSEASEMIVFLKDFFPDAAFVLAPVRH